MLKTLTIATHFVGNLCPDIRFSLHGFIVREARSFIKHWIGFYQGNQLEVERSILFVASSHDLGVIETFKYIN